MSTEPIPAPAASAAPETGAAAPSSSVLPQAAPQAAWPERVDTGEHQVSYRIAVRAPARELWALLADPHRHHEVDGSGTVQRRVAGPHRLAAGDRFRVAMRKFGLPYSMPLTATAVDEGALVEWAHPGGHRWRWTFEDAGDGTARVTETFDYSWARPAVRRGYELAGVPAQNGRGIQASLTRLAGRHL